MENYMIGALFCRCYAMKGGTCIVILDNIKFDRVNLDKYCDDFDIELCAVRIQNESSYIYVLSVYRAPSSNFSNFMLKMDEVLKSLYTLKTEFIICGDFNIDYLTDNYKKTNLAPF
jgi:exonuclease III